MSHWRGLIGWAAVVACAAAGGCVTRTRVESAALTMPWPQPPSESLGVYAPTNPDYPTAGGDILKGASPEELAKARAAAVAPLQTPGRP